jgi:hypothetical protein
MRLYRMWFGRMRLGAREGRGNAKGKKKRREKGSEAMLKPAAEFDREGIGSNSHLPVSLL